MEGELQFDGFSAAIDSNGIVLRDDKGGMLRYTPSQSEGLRDLVGALQKIASLPVFPGQVPGVGFLAKLKGDGEAEIIAAADNPDTSVGFHFNVYNAWPIIEAIDKSLAKAKDVLIHAPKYSSRPMGTQGSDNIDLIEGKL